MVICMAEITREQEEVLRGKQKVHCGCKRRIKISSSCKKRIHEKDCKFYSNLPTFSYGDNTNFCKRYFNL